MPADFDAVFTIAYRPSTTDNTFFRDIIKDKHKAGNEV